MEDCFENLCLLFWVIFVIFEFFCNVFSFRFFNFFVESISIY